MRLGWALASGPGINHQWAMGSIARAQPSPGPIEGWTMGPQPINGLLSSAQNPTHQWVGLGWVGLWALWAIKGLTFP